MKRSIDWLQFGQFLQMVVVLFTTIKTELKKKNIGPEILEWLSGSGKDFFVRWLVTLGEEHLRFFERKQKLRLQLLCAKVDLNADPEPSFFDLTLTRHTKQGEGVGVEYRPDEDELYVNGQKIVPYLSEEQLAGRSILTSALYPKALGNKPLNATLADWLYRNQAFIPKKWRDRVWYFWASGWSGDMDRCFVRVLEWVDAGWIRRDTKISGGWLQPNPTLGPSASL